MSDRDLYIEIASSSSSSSLSRWMRVPESVVLEQQRFDPRDRPLRLGRLLYQRVDVVQTRFLMAFQGLYHIRQHYQDKHATRPQESTLSEGSRGTYDYQLGPNYLFPKRT
jgi:hypothetical protein